MYNQWLHETAQLEKAGAIKEKEGDLTGAVSLYLKANLPSRAAKLITSNYELMNNTDLVNRIAASLIKLDFYEQVNINFYFIKLKKLNYEFLKRLVTYLKD